MFPRPFKTRVSLFKLVYSLLNTDSHVWDPNTNFLSRKRFRIFSDESFYSSHNQQNYQLSKQAVRSHEVDVSPLLHFYCLAPPTADWSWCAQGQNCFKCTRAMNPILPLGFGPFLDKLSGCCNADTPLSIRKIRFCALGRTGLTSYLASASQVKTLGVPDLGPRNYSYYML